MKYIPGIYYSSTGDPFADIGGYVIECMSKQFPGKDIMFLIQRATNIYVNIWGGKLNAFFLNSTITQPAFKEDRKIEETLKFYQELTDDKRPYKEGFCRITGKKTKLFSASRANHILSGSGTFVNFHHTFEPGIFLSKEVLIRVFFVPLGVLGLGDKIALLTSNIPEVTKYFVKENYEQNTRNISATSKEAKSVLKSKFRNPENALFKFAYKWIKEQEQQEEDIERPVTLNLYHFTNFGASPEVQLYTLPSKVFRFYKRCLARGRSKYWQEFVNAHYRHKNGEYVPFTGQWEITDKKESQVIKADEFEVWYNAVYYHLLHEKPILHLILAWTEKHSFPFSITGLYQTNIRDMEQKTIDKIEELAQFIIDLGQPDKIKRAVREIEKPKKPHELRRFLLVGLVKPNYKAKNEKPIITVDEYANYLFPDGTYWQDIRLLLLIAIYQKLHENGIWLHDDSQDEEEDKDALTTENDH